ncbi:MAG TPA: response regulator [Candidatus Paceibacterota bacterium]|jgi:CheY-like chemotaxis protein|nr:response regulator [Candidatus Paceibacterota bacterium]
MKKILVIEDDDFLRDLEGGKFAAKGLDATFAKSSEETDAALHAMTPDIVLLDLLLPGVDGFEILKKLKADEKTKNIPVVVFSNLSEQKDIDRAMSEGALEFIVKSNYTLNEIVEKIDAILNTTSPTPQAHA